MGCKAFTPPLVGLANELRNEPFHLVASHNQNGSASQAVHEIFQNGLDLDSPNVSVTKSAHHPGVQGTGYVPYYMVFDHHGDLVFHHQGGPYHGGDGLAVLDRVRTMLERVPEVYLGKDPYAQHGELAASLASGQRLGEDLSRLTQELARQPGDKELERLSGWIERHVERSTEHLAWQLSESPEQASRELARTIETFAETPWAAPLIALQAQLQGPGALEQHTAAAAQLHQALKTWAELKTVSGNRGKVRNPLDATFRGRNGESLPKVAGLLRQAAQDPDSPAGRRAAEMLRVLGGL